MAGTAGARVELCGGLSVEIGGRSVDELLRGHRLRLLFAYLVLHRERTSTRDELAGAIWQDDPPASPGAALSVLLTRLRRALGPAAVGARGDVRLVLPEPVDVDVEEALGALERARSGTTVDAEERLAAAGRAIAILERELLPGLQAPWLDDRREVLRDALADALEIAATVAARLRGTALDDAEQAARRLIEIAPYRETGYRALMEAHARRGNVAEALKVYEVLRVLLREELGAAPAPEVQALHERLLREPPRSRASAAAAPLPGLLADAEANAFVGRTTELARLEEALAGAALGELETIAVAGEAGSGKTRLLARFAVSAHEEGATVLYGRCDEHRLVGYRPFTEAIAPYLADAPQARLREAAATAGPELARLLPGLADRLGVRPQDAAGSPAVQRHRLFESLARLVSGIASSAPLVLVLDDLQWADGPSLALLRHLVRSAQPPSTLVVVLYRKTEIERGSPVHELMAQLRQERLVAELPLGGIRAEEAVELVRSEAGVPVAEALAVELTRATGGNPLFVREIVRELLDRRMLDAAAAAAEAGHELPPAVPPVAREVLARRLARLDDAVLEALRLAAVVGEEFDVRLLAAVSEIDVTALRGALERAAGAGLVVSPASGGDRFRFEHALVRAALYDEFGITRRAELHRRVGEALERLSDDGDEDLGALAHHFFCARSLGEGPRAVDYSLRAAQHAAAGLAFEDAAALYERALAAMRAAPVTPEERCETLLGLGEARTNAGMRADAREAFAAAAAIARSTGSAPRLARAALGVAGPGHGATGAVDADAVAALEEADRVLGDLHPDLTSRVLSRLAVELYWADEEERRRELGDRAVAAARRAADARALAPALLAQTWAGWGPDNPHARISTTKEARELGHRARDEEVELEAWTWQIAALLELGEVDRADAELELYAERAERYGRAPYVVYSRIARGSRGLMSGRYPEVQALTDEAERIGNRLDDPNTGGMVAAKRIWLALELGGVEPLIPTVAVAAESLPAMPVWRAILALLYVHAGRPEDARGELEAIAAGHLGRVPRDMFWTMTLGVLAEVVVTLDDAARAEELLGMLAPYASRNVAATLDISLGCASRLLGSLATTAARYDEAEHYLDDALRVHAEWGAAPWTAHTHFAYARLLAARGEGDRGAEHVHAAAAIAERLGMTTLSARLARERALAVRG